MFYSILLCLIIQTVVCFAINIPEDALLTVPQIIRKYGYPFERHWVTTEDGYIISLFRIPYGRIENGPIRPPVLLVHGLAQASDSWILPGPKNALAYNLADSGYDVWMLNCRGTTYSLNHTFLDPNANQGQFWDFSFYEIGIYDLPASIDHILEQTKHRKLLYSGVSQGGAVFFILCSELPSYNDKIASYIGLAPAVYVSHIRIPAHDFWLPVADYVLPNLFANISFNIESFFRPMKPMTISLCAEESKVQEFCWSIICMNFGCNRKEFTNKLLSVMVGHVPSSYSSKQFQHFYQNLKSGRFARFDYGKEKNRKMYNTPIPPAIDLSNVNVPVYIFYSEGDPFVSSPDIFRLSGKLRTLQNVYVMPDKEWTHLDFVFASSIKTALNDPMINIFNHYRNAIIN